jgi:hypothetical protein
MKEGLEAPDPDCQKVCEIGVQFSILQTTNLRKSSIPQGAKQNEVSLLGLL